MPDDPYIRRCRVLRVVDGDSMHMTVDNGYRRRSDEAIRLLEIDTPEINKGTVEERARGIEARNFKVAWLEEHVTHSTNAKWDLWIASEKSDDFARWLGDVYCDCGAHLVADLIAAGHDTGKRWSGNTIRASER